MPQGRPATGSVRFEGGRWKARLTLDGHERLVPIEPPLTKPADREKAVIEARELAKLASGAHDARSCASELVEDWYERWLSARKEKGKRIKSPRSHLTMHILPVLRGRTMASVTRADLERIVQQLDDERGVVGRQVTEAEAGGRGGDEHAGMVPRSSAGGRNCGAAAEDQ